MIEQRIEKGLEKKDAQLITTNYSKEKKNQKHIHDNKFNKPQTACNQYSLITYYLESMKMDMGYRYYKIQTRWQRKFWKI